MKPNKTLHRILKIQEWQMAKKKTKKNYRIVLPLGQREYPGNQLNNVSITDKPVAWR